MTTTKKPRMLFAAYMAGGVRTILQNLGELIGPRTDVDSAFVPVEMDQESQVLGKVRKRSLIPGSIRNSAVTASRIRALEAEGGPFDAAFFYPHTICILLWRFRRRVPYVVAMDGTPLWYAQHRALVRAPVLRPQGHRVEAPDRADPSRLSGGVPPPSAIVVGPRLPDPGLWRSAGTDHGDAAGHQPPAVRLHRIGGGRRARTAR